MTEGTFVYVFINSGRTCSSTLTVQQNSCRILEQRNSKRRNYEGERTTKTLNHNF